MMGKRALAAAVAAMCILLGAFNAGATDTLPYAFTFSGPNAVSAPQFTPVSINVAAVIDQWTLDAANLGLQGWSMSIENTTPALSDVVGPTNTGADTAAFLGGTPFEITENATSAEGAIQAIVLNLLGGVTLPDGTHTTILMTLEGFAPAAGVTETWSLRYVDGLSGSGQPVSNVGTVQGQSITPTVFGYDVRVTGTAVVPAPAALPAGLALLGMLAARRRRRSA